eukprot:228835-Rhodomonas_salina.2
MCGTEIGYGMGSASTEIGYAYTEIGYARAATCGTERGYAARRHVVLREGMVSSASTGRPRRGNRPPRSLPVLPYRIFLCRVPYQHTLCY